MLSAISPTSIFDSERRSRLIRTTRKLGKVLGTAPRAQREPSSSSSTPTTFHLYSVTSRDSTYSTNFSRTAAGIAPPIAPDSFTFVYSNAGSRRNSIDMTSVLSSDSITPTNSVSLHSTCDVENEPQPIQGTKFQRDPSPSASMRSVASHHSEASGSNSSVIPRPPSPDMYHERRNDTSPQASSSEFYPSPVDTLPVQIQAMPTTGPTWPELDEPSEEERRRRKIDKLTRTLGEHIPTELIFPVTNASSMMNEFLDTPTRANDHIFRSKKDKGPKTSRRASVSISTLTHLTSFATILRSLTPSPETASMESTTVANASSFANIHDYSPHFSTAPPPESRAGMHPATNMLSDKVLTTAPEPPHPPSPPPFSILVHDSNLDGTRTSTLSRTKSFSHPHRSPRTHVHTLSDPRPESPFVDNLVPSHPGLFIPPETEYSEGGKAVVRKERRQGWSGEWNQDNMQDVIKKLRSLK